MENFKKLKISKNKKEKECYDFTSKDIFKEDLFISNKYIQEVFDFAYEMSLEFHREHRTGGNHKRKPNEIFANTFTGKLAEYALYEYISNQGIKVKKPNIEVYPRSQWDKEDIVIVSENGTTYTLNVKSTKHYGHLMLLEEGDYDSAGMYIPDKSKSDFYVLVRIKFNLESKLKSKRFFFNDTLINRGDLQKIINETIQDASRGSFEKKSNKIFYDIPGYMTHDELVHIINDKFIIKQDEYLNDIPMDASNYYVQSGDLHSINKFVKRKL